MKRIQTIVGYRKNGCPIYKIAGGAPTLAELREQDKALEQRAAEIAKRMKEIHDEAGDDHLSEERADEWGKLEKESGEIPAKREDLKSQIEDTERRDQIQKSRRKWTGVQVGTRVSPFDGEDVFRMGRQDLQSRALAALERHDDVGLSDQQLTRMERMLRTRNDHLDGGLLAQRLLVTEHPDYRAAFMRLVTRNHPVLTPEMSRAVQAWEEYRGMTVGTGSEGGFGVPVLIDPTIILTGQGHPNVFMQLARVETITTNEWKGVSSSGMEWQFRAEGASASDNSPALAQPAVPAHRADGYIPYTLEVDQDYPGFAGEMSTLLGEGYSELLVDRFTIGTGVVQPTGIITALDGTASEVDTAVTNTIAEGDINGLWAALPIRYRSPVARTAWMSTTAINGAIQQLGEGNDAAFTVSFTEEGVLRLKGRPALENDYMRNLSGAAVAGLLIVGDWRNYLIAQRAGMSIELIPHVVDTSGAKGVPTGERAWFAWARVGADSINDAGFRMLSDDGL